MTVSISEYQYRTVRAIVRTKHYAELVAETDTQQFPDL
jgi:hypothetical protein